LLRDLSSESEFDETRRRGKRELLRDLSSESDETRRPSRGRGADRCPRAHEKR
jgi:hypothetical protein